MMKSYMRLRVAVASRFCVSVLIRIIFLRKALSDGTCTEFKEFIVLELVMPF